ncbi:MAG: DUF3014 domain-containing protein [bacterium]|nr:DUF3014 domain-containing protein [bacterium]
MMKWEPRKPNGSTGKPMIEGGMENGHGIVERLEQRGASPIVQESANTLGGAMEEQQSTNRTPILVFAVLVVALVIVGFLVRGIFFGENTENLPAPIPMTPTPEPSPTPTLAERLSERLRGVTMATSDAAIRPLVAEMSAHPKLAEWLLNDDLVRRFVASVANIADGESPKGHLEFLSPGQRFKVKTVGAETRIDPASYRRYDLVVTVFDSLDVEGTVALFKELEPLFDDAYAEIAPRGRKFDETFAQAVDHLLAVPVIEERPELKSLVVTYEFADTKLEELTDAQRQLLRMGPENVSAVQSKLRELLITLQDGRDAGSANPEME